MTRGRRSNRDEAAREPVEGSLAVLGNARVYVHLVRLRINAAMMMGSTTVLDVAIEDLERLEGLIKRAQAQINQINED